MSYYFRERFIESTKRRAASEKTLLRAENLLPDVLMDIVLEYSHINSGLTSLFDIAYITHAIGDMSVMIGGSNQNCIERRNKIPDDWSIILTIFCGAIEMPCYILISDVLEYIECGDIPEESDTMRVISETFAYCGTDYTDSHHSGVLLVRSFFDYCIWDLNRLDATVRYIPDAYSSDDD